MLTKRIKELTEQLNQLRIEQDRLRQQEIRIVNAIIQCHEHPEARQRDKAGEGVSPKTKQDPGQDNGPNKPKTSAKQKGDNGRGDIAVGSRVSIKNPKPRAGTSTLIESDTQGTVTRKSKFFIFIKTDNPLNKQEVRRARANVQSLN